jgi:DNA-binding protein YbaB
VDAPQWSALGNLVADLRRTMGSVSEIQQAALRVTGTAWSPDRLVRVTVGPRGQLVDLEIDPRVYRNPNSTALAQTILATARAAAEQAMAEVRKLIDQHTPADLRSMPVDGLDVRALSRQHDADLLKED